MTTVLESLNSALRRAMHSDSRVYILGEDILDPYGGAFKVTKGLSSEFPSRVLTTPVSEAGISGLAAGMALRGLRPVVEIMFGDFITLAADQLINHIAKFRWMYNNQVRVPLVVRIPMGGRRGYGPTHSQSLEKLFLGVPGLKVLAPCTLGDPGVLLIKAILEDDDPVLFIENKLLYTAQIQNPESLQDFDIHQEPVQPSAHELQDPLTTKPYASSYRLTLLDAPDATITIVAYSYMAELAREALSRLAYEYEVFGELIVPTQLTPFDATPILASTQRTGHLLVLEEASQTLGWGAEVLAQISAQLGRELQHCQRLGARDVPIPASGPLETAVLPHVEDILQAALQMG
jgi:pyruvate/2-oxoglutarate/acetoin dehydrogenase E1 component